MKKPIIYNFKLADQRMEINKADTMFMKYRYPSATKLFFTITVLMLSVFVSVNFNGQQIALGEKSEKTNKDIVPKGKIPSYTATLSKSINQPITGWGCFPGFIDQQGSIGTDKKVQDLIYRDLGMTVARVKIYPKYGNKDGSLNTIAIDTNLARLPDRTMQLPALRDQVSLNGTWSFTPRGADKTTIPVPAYWDTQPGFKTDNAVYEREVVVPESFKGKRTRVEFESICQVADVYVNGKFVGNHIGGWIPFAFDITDFVTPGHSFILRVDVKGGNYEPIVDKKGRVQWPVGWYGFRMRWGINSNVWLRGYGEVSIQDAFVITSYRKKSISVQYTLQNSDSKSRTITINGDILNPLSGKVEKKLSSGSITLSPQESKSIIINSNWENPLLWYPYPDTRHPLYHLVSSLKEEDKEVDRETRRFGFREIWIEKGQYKFNGVRLNLWGNSITAHHEGYRRNQTITPESWPQTIDKWFEMNVRFARFHMAPADQFVIDACDEKGFLVLEESAIYSREYLRPDSIDTQAYTENAKKWIKPWVISRRNHPSIIQWSAENEMALFSGWPEELLQQFGEEITKLDTTRPISYDGESTCFKKFNADVYNTHYPEGYEASWKAPIYGFKIRQENVPNGIGEFLTSYGKNGQENQWMHGLIIRCLRYTDWSDIRPYTLSNNLTSEKGQTLKNGCAFVALFDKEYDQLGIAPLADGKLPELPAGSMQTRVLALYNDEFHDSSVTVEITIKSGDRVYATGKKSVVLSLGEHADLPCSFQVPEIGGSVLEMVLQTSKQGEIKFSESKRFAITGKNTTNQTSSKVIIDPLKPMDINIKSEMNYLEQPDSIPGGKRALIRVTLTNQDSTQTAVGQANIILESFGIATIVGSSVMHFLLKSGISSSADFVVESKASRTMIKTLSTARMFHASELPLDIAFPMKRFESAPKLEQLADILPVTEPGEITYSGKRFANIRYAIGGKFLIIHAEVFDSRINADLKEWPETSVDVFASVPGTSLVRQVVFHLKGSKDTWKTTLHENGKELPVEGVSWRANALANSGYSLDAQIPLSLYNLDEKSSEILFDCAVSTVPGPRIASQYLTLFNSQAAFKNNIRFGLFTLKTESLK